jgi:hypothetical protein
MGGEAIAIEQCAHFFHGGEVSTQCHSVKTKDNAGPATKSLTIDFSEH